MLALKNLLKIRDNNDSHATVRENGNVGIPTLVVDDVSYLIDGAQGIERLIEELGL